MCLILFAYKAHRDYRLIALANRDEFYDRPSCAADFWPEQPQLLAGKDLQGGGTWMGITRTGRFAAITNFREFPPDVKIVGVKGERAKKTRGLLTCRFLMGTQGPREYLEVLSPQANDYTGFNLLLDDGRDIYYFSNRQNELSLLTPGVYGLSNQLLDTPWPKVAIGKTQLQQKLAKPSPDNLWPILLDQQRACDSELPDTGIGLEKERLLSSRFIHSQVYGTRASSLLFVGYNGNVNMLERNFDATGEIDAVRQFCFAIE